MDMDESEVALLSELEAALIREAALLQGQEGDDDITRNNIRMAAAPRPDPMALTDAERDYALLLKSKLKENPEMPPLTDFQIAHHALVDSEQRLALAKMEGLQEFRQMYEINDTVEQGVYYLHQFMTQQSAFVLHLDVTDDSYEAIRVLDIARLNPAAAMAVHPQHGVDYHWKQFVCGLYYMHTACSPYLASIRQGVFEIADLDSFGSHNLSMEFEYRRHGELIGNFPLRFKTIMAYNTGYLANVGWNLMKPIMNENAKKSIQLGCQVVEADGSVSNRRLSEFYLQPNVHIAQQSVLARAKTMLQMRYHNEQEFRLV